jgi:gamma-glutamylputrescine oxidase
MLLHPDFREEPYWWRAAPPEDTRPEPIPESADVVVVGAGVCGMSAAIEAARQGAKTVVVDGGCLGGGASGRSGGMVTASPKAALYDTLRKPGGADETALAETTATLAFLKQLVHREDLDADLQICGRFYGAFSPHHLARLRLQAALLARRTQMTVRVVEPEEQHTEIGSSYFHGGFVVEEYGGVHPAKLTQALAKRARASGASLHSHARVVDVTRYRSGHELMTERGVIRADRVLFATNGYTDQANPWARRRILPVASYQVATEPLPPGLMDELIPKRRMVSDSRKDLVYLRASPDNSCLIFGCRPRAFDRPPAVMARHLHARLVRVFPQLADCRITHAWSGLVGMTRDTLPHIAEHDGIISALGCNGSGIALMTWLGWQAARVLLSGGRVPVVADHPFRGIPLRSTASWIAALATLGYHLQDFASRPVEVAAERLGYAPDPRRSQLTPKPTIGIKAGRTASPPLWL